LQDAFARLRAEGTRINAKSLAATAHVDHKVAKEFLRTHWNDEMEQEQLLRDHDSLEQAYALLQARGEPITSRALCKVAHVDLTQVGAFLRSKAGNEEQRMHEAYARLQREGVTPIGRGRLARAAQVSRDRSAKYLHVHQLQGTTSR
jgi:ferritin